MKATTTIAALLLVAGLGAACAIAAPPDFLPPPPDPDFGAPPPAWPPNFPRNQAPLPAFIIDDDDDPCVPRFWGQVDYGLFFLSPLHVPAPILTTSPPASRGVLGAPGTSVLIGDISIYYGASNTFQFYSGGWWNCDRTFGSEGTSDFLEERARSYTASSDGSVVLARPIINANTNTETSTLAAFPGLLVGNVTMENRVRFANSDGNLIYNLFRDDHSWVNVLLGYRYVYLWEQIIVIQNQRALVPGALVFLNNPIAAGNSLAITDRFETNNNLFLVQVGLRGETIRGRLRLHGAVKLGLGWSHQRLFADGRTTNNATGQTVPGGILAQPTYPYRTGQDRFVVIPELSGKVGYQITPRLSAWAGYTFLYVSSVARPGTQIDRTINPTIGPSFPTFAPFAGPVRPFVPRNASSLFVNGITFGLSYQF